MFPKLADIDPIKTPIVTPKASAVRARAKPLLELEWPSSQEIGMAISTEGQ